MPESTGPKIARQTVREMARLVGLELTEDQLDRLEPEMESLAKNIERLREIDFGDTEPVFQFRPAVGDERAGRSTG